MRSPGEKYRPSNGTEGMGFKEKFCLQCIHCDPNPSGKKQCKIWFRALAYETNEPEYPTEWTYDEKGKPTCTNWTKWDWGNDGNPDDPENPKAPIPNDPNQLSLFPVYPDERDFIKVEKEEIKIAIN
jgi:hypothetical protein